MTKYIGKSGLRKFLIIIVALLIILILGLKGKLENAEWAIVSICTIAISGYVGEYKYGTTPKK